MPAGTDFLWCVARHLPKYVLKYVADATGLGLLWELSVDVWNDYQKRPKAAGQLRDDLAALAQTNPASAAYRQQVAQITEAAAAGQPAAVRQAMTTYFLQLPGTVRRSLRRPADPTGTTIPLNLRLEKAQDLAPFFPSRLPRFKPGDRPLSGCPLQLDELLGAGGFGEVWKARNPQLPLLPAVALKFCLDREAARVLRNEAKVLAQAPHPGIVKLQHADLAAEPPWLEYEYVEGGELGMLIEEWHRTHGGPNPVKAARVIYRLAEIVGAVHQLQPPIVHRDLKPANILVQRVETLNEVFPNPAGSPRRPMRIPLSDRLLAELREAGNAVGIPGTRLLLALFQLAALKEGGRGPRRGRRKQTTEPTAEAIAAEAPPSEGKPRRGRRKGTGGRKRKGGSPEGLAAVHTHAPERTSDEPVMVAGLAAQSA